jgi:hypothetical protein
LTPREIQAQFTAYFSKRFRIRALTQGHLGRIGGQNIKQQKNKGDQAPEDQDRVE